MKQYFLIFFALTFTLTGSASASMMCCWGNSGSSQTQEQNSDMPPCHEEGMDEETDNPEIPTASGCCSDMSLCKAPLIYGGASAIAEQDRIQQTLLSSPADGLISNSTIPPTPPPKLFL